MCKRIRQKQQQRQRQIYNQDTDSLGSCCLPRAWSLAGPVRHAMCSEKQIVGESKQERMKSQRIIQKKCRNQYIAACREGAGCNITDLLVLWQTCKLALCYYWCHSVLCQNSIVSLDLFHLFHIVSSFTHSLHIFNLHFVSAYLTEVKHIICWIYRP